MSIQALGPLIECLLFKGARYGILVSIANHADQDGYAWVGYNTIAAESRSTRRHVIRIIDAMDDEAKAAIEAGRDDWAMVKVSTGQGPYGTNEYQLNMELIHRAHARVLEARRLKRAKMGRGVASGHPPHDSGVTNNGVKVTPGVTGGGDSKSHPYRSPSSRTGAGAREPGGGSRARNAERPDDMESWGDIRGMAREAFGEEAWRAEMARLRSEGLALVAPTMAGARWVSERAGVFFREHGYTHIVTDDGGEIEL